MNDMGDFDLLDLDDSVFKVQEVVFNDENELFQLIAFLDEFVDKNATAKSDGVFKGRLAERLRDKGSDIQQAWPMFEKSVKTNLVVQYLKASDDPKCFVMEHQTRTIPESRAKEFIKALQNPNTLNYPKLNCCTKVLQERGEKAAVKHFYEELQLKALRAEHWQEPVCPNVSYQKDKYKSRQKLLESPDPVTKCFLIEASMESKMYSVINTPAATDNNYRNCKCHSCHLDQQTVELTPQERKLDASGNSENCSVYFTDVEETCGQHLYITKNFALSHLCHLNMLTDLTSYYPGVSFPFAYIGGHHSFFPIHVEDMSLWSINFHHKGDPKFFVVVSPRHALKLSRVLTNYGMSNYHRNCLYKLSHKNAVVFPQLLLHHRISFKIIIQRPGDFLFLAPNAAHTGGNMGVNMAEACNVGTLGWLPYASVAQHHNCNCIEEQVHMCITPLIQMHKAELLKYHLTKSMHVAFPDEFFLNSIIVPYQECYQEAGSVTHPTSSSTMITSSSEFTSSTVATSRAQISLSKKQVKAPVQCPVKGCFKEYKAPNLNTMVRHIDTEHPEKAQNHRVKDALKALFPSVKGLGLRRQCPDCGTDISVFSNKHQGNAICKKKATRL